MGFLPQAKLISCPQRGGNVNPAEAITEAFLLQDPPPGASRKGRQSPGGGEVHSPGKRLMVEV